MEILTNVKDILQMARDERCSGYTAELLVKDLNELIALREAGEKMKAAIEYIQEVEDLWGKSYDKSMAALEAWEAANK